MWKKIQRYTNIPIILLATLITAKTKDGSFNMISWKTQDGLLHICSFENFNDVTDNDIDSQTRFTIWEKVNEKI